MTRARLAKWIARNWVEVLVWAAFAVFAIAMLALLAEWGEAGVR